MTDSADQDQDQTLILALRAKIARLEQHPAVKELKASRDYLALLTNGRPVAKVRLPEDPPAGELAGKSMTMPARPAEPGPAVVIPQSVGGKRLRPGTLRYQIISGAIRFLWDKTESVHRREILRYLRQHGVLADLDEPTATYRLANVFSGARDLFETNKDGFWSLMPQAKGIRPTPYVRRNKTEVQSG